MRDVTSWHPDRGFLTPQQGAPLDDESSSPSLAPNRAYVSSMQPLMVVLRVVEGTLGREPLELPPPPKFDLERVKLQKRKRTRLDLGRSQPFAIEGGSEKATLIVADAADSGAPTAGLGSDRKSPRRS
jgi:hypothetical protein